MSKHVFKATPEEDEARDFASKVRDVSELLAELDVEPPALPKPIDTTPSCSSGASAALQAAAPSRLLMPPSTKSARARMGRS